MQAAEDRARQQHAPRPETLATLTPEEHIAGIPGLSEHKRAFLRAHPELVEPANAQIAVFFFQQALARGIQDDTAEMDHAILRGVQSATHHEQIGQALSAAAEPARTPSRAGPPVSAPVSRDVPGYGGGHASRGKVELSPSEREAARFSGVSEREYAANKLRLQEAKQGGRYMEPS